MPVVELGTQNGATAGMVSLSRFAPPLATGREHRVVHFRSKWLSYPRLWRRSVALFSHLPLGPGFQAAFARFAPALICMGGHQASTFSGSKPLPALTTFGEVTVRRRLYRNRETGETAFLLDKALGLPPRARVTPRLEELMVKLATELSFARAAEVLGYFVPGISAMTVWHALPDGAPFDPHAPGV